MMKIRYINKSKSNKYLIVRIKINEESYEVNTLTMGLVLKSSTDLVR